MTVPPGFRVELVASEPQIVNPVAMTFDERGRIWITESLEYPRHAAGPGRDRVQVLEDTDGDGRADSFTTFAAGLNIPSGIAVGYGGVWVANAPDILFLRDSNGDGKADERDVVVTGFGRHDTHELPNSLTWGPDGWLYGWNGVFNRSRVTQHGKTFDFTCALFRINPRTRDFELFCEGTSNPWGIAWDTEGSAFSSACVVDHLWHLAETGSYHRQAGAYPAYAWPIDSIVNHRHQKAAYCGIHYFDSPAYPAEYRGLLTMGNIHGNAINVDRLARAGSTYSASARPDLLDAHDAWFMPVVQKTGPDGCLYILDWYDRYHCYQDAGRDPAGIDRLKGRLYRIRYKESPRAPRFDLAQETDEQLIRRLHSPNVYFRDLAQRLLAERNEPSSRERLQALVLDGQAPRKPRMHALWALIGGGPLATSFHLRLLEQRDSGLRAWGVRAAGNQGRLDPPVRSRVLALASDPAPEVALQVAIAARKIAGVDPLPLLVEVLAHCGDDKLIPHIAWQNLHPLLEDRATEFVRVISRVDLKVRTSQGLVATLPRALERLLGRRRFEPVLVATILRVLIQAGTPDALAAARSGFSLLAARVHTGEVTDPQLDALRDQCQAVVRPILAGRVGDPLYREAALLATTWRDPVGVEATRHAFNSPELSAAQRLEALDALIGAGDPQILDSVTRRLAEPKRPGSTEFRGRLLAALGRLDDPRVAALVLARYPSLEPELRPKAVELLTQRPAWSRALLRAVERGQVPDSALNVNQLRKLLNAKDPEVEQRIKTRWGIVREGRDPRREQVIQRVRTLLDGEPGNPRAGARVFDKVCAQCHMIYGKGQNVGSDITHNGRGSFDQLLSNVLDPSLIIGAAYQATTVATSDGRILSGLLVEDSPARVVLKLPGGKLETIARGDVEEEKVSSLSLMPEDLEKQLQPQEIIDLFAFLALDKPPDDPDGKPIPGTPETVRRAVGK
jgi:putative membrane-bound dehydrogenase-like protein